MVPMWAAVGAVSCIFWFGLDHVATLIPQTVLLQHKVRRSEDLFLPNLIHHACSGLGAIVVWALEDYSEVPQPQRSFQCLPPATPLAEFLPSISLGYGLHDFAYGVRTGQASFWLHGLLISLALLVVCHLRIGHNLARLEIMNLSTIFLILRRVDFGPAINRCVDVTFVVLFFALRVVLIPLWWIQYLRYSRSSDSQLWGPCINAGVLALVGVSGIAMHSLNAYWFWHICQKMVAVAFAKEESRAAGVAHDDDPAKLK